MGLRVTGRVTCPTGTALLCNSKGIASAAPWTGSARPSHCRGLISTPKPGHTPASPPRVTVPPANPRHLRSWESLSFQLASTPAALALWCSLSLSPPPPGQRVLMAESPGPSQTSAPFPAPCPNCTHASLCFSEPQSPSL